MNKDLQKAHLLMSIVRDEVHKRIVGMDDVIDHALITIFAGGNGLLEGVPGNAKTFLVKTLAEVTDVQFSRIQMTPDLMPRDLWFKTSMTDGQYTSSRGTIFTNFFLADEINRTGPKVQSALLEAMEEKQVTTEKGTEQLPSPFVVFATENPIEQGGTYELPEAQKDRFLLKIPVGYPSHEEEVRIATLSSAPPPVQKVMSGEDILRIQWLVENEIYMDPVLIDKFTTFVRLTRPEISGIARKKFSTGVSPRATQKLTKAVKAMALLRGRDHVLPEDIIDISYPGMCHRVVFPSEIFPNEYDDVFREIMNEIIREVFGHGGNDGQKRA